MIAKAFYIDQKNSCSHNYVNNDRRTSKKVFVNHECLYQKV